MRPERRIGQQAGICLSLCLLLLAKAKETDPPGGKRHLFHRSLGGKSVRTTPGPSPSTAEGANVH